MDLCEMEIKVLRECAGELPASPWGAAVGACLEHLRGLGYVTSQGEPTERGRRFLRECPRCNDWRPAHPS